MGAAESLCKAAGTDNLMHDDASKQYELLGAPVEVVKQYIAFQKEVSIRHAETTEAKAERYIKRLNVSVSSLISMSEAFTHELALGLTIHREDPFQINTKKCSFKMLDSCIKNLPNGKETGVFYALDFGGTNFRVVRACLGGNGEISVTKSQQSLCTAKEGATHPRGLLDCKATATELFDFFARTVKEFMIENGDFYAEKKTATAGFTFSYPCQQRNVASAMLVNWTKGFATGRETDDPVEGLDVVELMNVSFKRNGVPMCCNSVLNDTVGTLISCAYSMNSSLYPPCLVGVILGTGLNCCYYEDTAAQYKYQGNVINVECGNFNRALPNMNIDCELDFHSVETRGTQQLEKMCSGAYLGEICRLILLRVLANRSPPKAWESYSLTTENITNIANDNTIQFKETRAIIEEIWGSEISETDARYVCQIAKGVIDRSAAVAAVVIASCAKKTGRLQPAFGGLSVAIDGSLYKCNPWYRKRVEHHLSTIIPSSLLNLLHITIADDGSGKGAAVLAATLTR